MPSLSKMSFSRRIAAGAAALVVAGAVGVSAVAGPAWATGGSTTTTPAAASAPGSPAGTVSLAAAKTKVDNRIDKAVARIDKVSAALAKDTTVSASDRASLSAKLATIRQQLTTLKATADAAPDVATLRSDVKGALASLKQTGDVAQVRAIAAAWENTATAALTARPRHRGPPQRRPVQRRQRLCCPAGTDRSPGQSGRRPRQGVRVGGVRPLRRHLSGYCQDRTGRAPAADPRAARTDIKTIRQTLTG